MQSEKVANTMRVLSETAISIFFLSPLDIDECHDKPCNADADCINVPGTYKCICRPGYTGDGFQCSGNTHSVTRPQCILNSLYFMEKV